MGGAFRCRPEHPQEVISVVTALRGQRLEIGIQIGIRPLDDTTKDVEWQSGPCALHEDPCEFEHCIETMDGLLHRNANHEVMR